MAAVIELREISRRFGQTVALNDVSLDIESGEIVCLAGENGAGKTTLMRIAAGVETPTSGAIKLDSRSVDAVTPSLAKRAGIALVHQHFLLVPEMTIAENLALADEATPFVLRRRDALRAARAAEVASGLPLGDLSRRVADLSVGEMSRVELVKALRNAPRLLILDEPTSVLSPPEVEELTAALRRLASTGTAIVVITHKLPEVFALADRIAVLRRGELVHVSDRGQLSPAGLARLMTGERVSAPALPQRRGDTLLALEHVATSNNTVTDATLQVASGEIVAIVGVAGNGQRELAMALRGLVSHRGEITVAGTLITQPELSEAQQIAHIPADRSNDGIFADMSVEENLAVGSLAQAPRSSVRAWQRRVADSAISTFEIRTAGASQNLRALSGGNQQKVILARELSRQPRLIIASEPTRGLDVSATVFVHTQLRSATAAGAGALVLTSDLDEALELADAIHVMYRGRTSDRVERPFSRGELGERMAGLG